MAIPILRNIISFDATKDFLLPFNYTGFQVRKNQLVIKNNETNIEAYNRIVESTLPRHNIPANTLQNGMTYNLQIQVFDVNNNASGFSELSVFTCLATPTFNFVNLYEDEIVQNSYIDLEINYSQPENELLNTYEVQLYNSSKTLIYNSEKKSSFDLKTMITGLTENTQYYMRAIGETVNHIQLDTGYVSFLCKYETSSSFSYLELKLNKSEASVTYTSNIVDIMGHMDSKPIYINNEMLDLRDNASVIFDKNFNIKNANTIEINAMNLTPYKTFAIFKNLLSVHEIRLNWYKTINYDTKETINYYVELEASGNMGKYYLYSNKLSVVNENDLIHIWLRKINDLFELIIVNKGGVSG